MDIGNLSAYTNILSSQLNNGNVDRLKSSLTTDNLDGKTDKELMDACKEFEAYFLEQVFKGMEKTVMKADNSFSSSSDTLVDFYKDEMYKKLAKQTTDNQSIGLAQQMYNQLKRNYSIDTVEATDSTGETE